MARIPRGRIARKHWPAELRRPCVVGVFIGGCVERGIGSSFRAKAHAHTSGDFEGWLCFRRGDRLACRELVIHELAHLLTGAGHTDVWRDMVTRLGGTLDAIPGMLRSYHKQPNTQHNSAVKAGATTLG